ncbi:MAG: hypothetical protein WCO84_08905, partial [bacterium]
MVARKKDKSSASKVASDAKKIEFRVAAPKFPSSQPIVSIGASADELLAHTELQSKAAFLEAQVNASRDGILVIDENNKRVLVNRRIIEQFDISPDILADADDTALLKYVVSLTRYPEQFLEKVMYLYGHANETSQDEIEFKNGMVLDRYS